MYCLRWWIPLFLFPFPKTTPFFLVLFLLSFTIHSKPCMYCAVILTGLFATSGNWYSSPNSITSLAPEGTLTTIADDVSLQSGRLSYSWLDLGFSGGNGFWNPTARPPQRFLSTPTKASKQQSQQQTTSSASKTESHFHIPIPLTKGKHLQVPKRFFVGLGKHGGLGVWIDLGSSKALPPSPLVQTSSSSDQGKPHLESAGKKLPHSVEL